MENINFERIVCKLPQGSNAVVKELRDAYLKSEMEV
jgi:hypothetical protein